MKKTNIQEKNSPGRPICTPKKNSPGRPICTPKNIFKRRMKKKQIKKTSKRPRLVEVIHFA